LFEQELYKSVQLIASQFQAGPLKTKYQAAAKDFRFPYWDFGVGTLPPSLSAAQVLVTGFDGSSRMIVNPLIAFEFRQSSPPVTDLDNSWNKYVQTQRYPTSPSRPQTSKSQNNLVAEVISNESNSLRSNLSLILLSPSYKNFDAFSHNAWAPSKESTGADFGSLEDVHNEIHDRVGGGGHMSALAVSAFDPIFWLHHCNVDRLFAIWQAVNPTAHMSAAGRRSPGNFSTKAGDIENEASPLKPFYDGSRIKFWNSAAVLKTSTFGYAYPETQRWNFTSDAAHQAAIRTTIASLYQGNALVAFNAVTPPAPAPILAPVQASAPTMPGPISMGSPALTSANFKPVAAMKSQMKVQAGDAANPAPAFAGLSQGTRDLSLSGTQKPLAAEPPLAANEVFEASLTAVAPPIKKMVDAKKYTDWITQVRVLKHGLSQTFRVLVFLGDFIPNVADWPTEYNLIGRVAALGQGANNLEGCTKCQVDAANDLQITGTVPLTKALLQDVVLGKVASLDAVDVIPYLQRNLHWRVTTFDGSEMPRDQVPGLKVGVWSTEVNIDADGIPVYSGQFASHFEVTEGRQGGFASGDQI
jgi:tyrosinase